MGRRKKKDPIHITIDGLEPKCASGLDAEGRRWKVRGAPLGATVLAQPGRKQSARLLEVTKPGPRQIEVDCPVFGLCGGCQLQQNTLADQRAAKQAMVEALVGRASHPILGAPAAYGYRNKLELSWSNRAWTVDPEDAGKEGSFLGFHPPGWWSKVLPLRGCPLGSPRMNEVIRVVADLGLGPAWDSHAHTGVYRHLVVREGDGLVVTLVTTSDAPPDEVHAAGRAIAACSGVTGVLWVVQDGVAEVATGDLHAVLHGEPTLQFTLGETTLRLPHDGFFQVNTPGAELLIQLVRQALKPGGTLLDLYCGNGAIGLLLGGLFDQVVGIELHEAAVEIARENAARNGVAGQWHAGKVEEVLEGVLPGLEGPLTVIVDPPRAGLHPAAARTVAGIEADVLIHVACNPKSLARDQEILAEGGWQMSDLWTVDLFPQTPHVEAVGRFVRISGR